MTWDWEPRLRKCRKLDCWRKVTQNVAYCCHACAKADEGGFELEPHDPALHWVLCHSGGCEQRSRERGECKDALEADALTQR